MIALQRFIYLDREFTAIKLLNRFILKGIKELGKMNTKEYKDRIVVNPKIHFGKPCVANTRITVENVLELIQENIPFEEIIQKYYPDLELEDVKACVKYATDIISREEIHINVA